MKPGRKILLSLLLALSLSTASVQVHHERLQVGPYPFTVSFSDWPVRAERSLDIFFAPQGGIAGKQANLTLVSPSGEAWEDRYTLPRHPVRRNVWGLDVYALPEAGRWTVRLEADGPRGSGTGELALNVLERPGPPASLGWLVGLLPLWGLIGLTAFTWRRVRPLGPDST